MDSRYNDDALSEYQSPQDDNIDVFHLLHMPGLTPDPRVRDIILRAPPDTQSMLAALYMQEEAASLDHEAAMRLSGDNDPQGTAATGDHELATTLAEIETSLETMLQQDFQLALKLSEADSSLETTMQQDHEFAMSLANAEGRPQTDMLATASEHMNDRLKRPPSYPSSDAGADIPSTSGLREEARRTPPGPEAKRKCTACQEELVSFDLVAAPCAHEYCKDCVQHLFSAAVNDESLFPPKCCGQPITIASVGDFLTRDIRRSFEEKETEYATANRTYCHRSTCSKFIRSQHIANDVAVCPGCRAQTCTMCKAAVHRGRDCPKDEELQQVLKLAEQKSWQRCYRCRRVTEKSEGCNLIT